MHRDLASLALGSLRKNHVTLFSESRMRVSRLLIVAALAAVSAPLACGDSTSTTPVGKLSVQVVDANGTGVQLAGVDLYKTFGSDFILWRTGLTSSDGIAVFGETDGGIAEGDYLVHVSFITNFTLAAGESNDKRVTVRGGDDLIVTFHAVAKGPGI
jgi:hypothetical protein